MDVEMWNDASEGLIDWHDEAFNIEIAQLIAGKIGFGVETCVQNTVPMSLRREASASS
ncbi:hypothetical protein [Methylobacterium oryzisoli]|uniref:hypothetical protein n=1 Tax=Methylobacterium oryzisoli TaxID=3385502 RepID=UPI0038914BB9